MNFYKLSTYINFKIKTYYIKKLISDYFKLFKGNKLISYQLYIFLTSLKKYFH